MTIPFILKKHKEEVQKTSDDIKILSDEQLDKISGGFDFHKGTRQTHILTVTSVDNAGHTDYGTDHVDDGRDAGMGACITRF